MRLRMISGISAPAGPGACDRTARLWPRNSFIKIRCTASAFDRRFALAGGSSLDGIVELFNASNHANVGSYTAQENNPVWPAVRNQDVAYQLRSVQLGLRLAC